MPKKSNSTTQPRRASATTSPSSKIGAVHMADDDAGEIRAGSSRTSSDLVRRLRVAAGMDGDRRAGPPLRDGRALKRPALERGQRPGAADLADDAATDGRAPGAFRNLRRHHIGQRLGRERERRLVEIGLRVEPPLPMTTATPERRAISARLRGSGSRPPVVTSTMAPPPASLNSARLPRRDLDVLEAVVAAVMAPAGRSRRRRSQG